MDDADSFETSEFSLYEILYMGHAGLTFFVEHVLDSQLMCDPFDIIAEMEERLGKPLAFQGETEM